MRSQNRDRKEGRDLVDELIGEETENEYTHKPDGTYEILNDIVVDRGPNPSTSSRLESLNPSYFQAFSFFSLHLLTLP